MTNSCKNFNNITDVSLKLKHELSAKINKKDFDFFRMIIELVN